MISVDLITLEGVLAKQGAMPTYIYRTGKLHKIASNNLPLGLSTKAHISRMKFKLHDIVLVMSDGIDDIDEDDIWEVLQNENSMQNVCTKIMKLSAGDDDKTIIAFRINLNK